MGRDESLWSAVGFDFHGHVRHVDTEHDEHGSLVEYSVLIHRGRRALRCQCCNPGSQFGGYIIGRYWIDAGRPYVAVVGAVVRQWKPMDRRWGCARLCAANSRGAVG